MKSELLPAVSTPVTRGLPSISVLLKFEPKMSSKSELESRLQQTVDEADKELVKKYPPAQYRAVLDKFRLLIKKLDYTTYMQSIAVFISPGEEKLYYLNIPVEEKIVIDTPLRVRDLVFSKKDNQRFLVLVLAGNHSQVFLADSSHFVRVASFRPRHAAACRHEMPERVANFTDPQQKKEIMMEKFLHYIDEGLGILMKAYSLPLFVLGAERTVGHFRKISHYSDQVSGYVHGNFEEAGEIVVRKAIAPLVADWEKIKQQALLQRVDAAMSAHKLAYGITLAAKEAKDKKGRLLLVERSLKRIEVDEAIEAVLANGGDVEFMDDEQLSAYGRIALIKYY